MNEVEKVDVRQANESLAGDVEIRIPKKWLVLAVTAVAVLLLLALD